MPTPTSELLKSNVLKFPHDIDINNHPIMIFQPVIWNTRAEKDNSKTTFIKDIKGSIALPLPSSGMEDSININWEELGGVSAGFKSIKGISSKIGNIIGEQIGDLLTYKEYFSGKIRNDFASMAFSGIDFREFTFTYSLIPNTEAEAKTIIDIINTFKYHSLPEISDYAGIKTAGIKYPDFWKLKAKFPNNNKFLQFKECVMTNFTTNWYPDAIMTQFRTGQPIKIDISIGLRELDKIERSNFQSG